MGTVEEFQTYNRYGDKTGVIKGVLLESYGSFQRCKGGLIIHLADIRPVDGRPVVTVYLEAVAA